MNTNVISLPTATTGRPLRPSAEHAAPYPVQQLGPLQAAVTAAQAITQAPTAIAAQSALALASFAVQGLANVETLGRFRPVSLSLFTIARSGERKSTVDRLLSGDLDESERTCSEPTIDGLFRVLKDNPSAGLLSDEGGSFLGGYAMKRAQAQRSYATLNSLWDGKQIKLARAREVTMLRGRRLTTHLMMQPDVAASLLADPMAEGIGYLPRCLIVQPESMIGKRTSQAAPVSGTCEIEAFQARLAALLALPLPIANPEDNALTPRELGLSDEARACLREHADMIELLQAPGGDFETVSAFASKTCEQACRIAGVLTLWRDENATVVSHGDMYKGLTLALYYLAEAKRLIDVSSTDTDLNLADELRVWLLARPSKTFLTADVQQCGPRREMRTKAMAGKLLDILEDHGWVRRLPEGTVIDGVPRKTAWTLT